jgi:hypothetical protein
MNLLRSFFDGVALENRIGTLTILCHLKAFGGDQRRHDHRLQFFGDSIVAERVYVDALGLQ